MPEVKPLTNETGINGCTRIGSKHAHRPQRNCQTVLGKAAIEKLQSVPLISSGTRRQRVTGMKNYRAPSMLPRRKGVKGCSVIEQVGRR